VVSLDDKLWAERDCENCVVMSIVKLDVFSGYLVVCHGDIEMVEW
jgi:hypothetical protein